MWNGKCDDIRKILSASRSLQEFNEFLSAYSDTLYDKQQIKTRWAYERIEDEAIWNEQGRSHGGGWGESPPQKYQKIMSWQNRVELITLTLGFSNLVTFLQLGKTWIFQLEFSNLHFPTWIFQLAFPTCIFQLEFSNWIFQLEFSNLNFPTRISWIFQLEYCIPAWIFQLEYCIPTGIFQLEFSNLNKLNFPTWILYSNLIFQLEYCIPTWIFQLEFPTWNKLNFPTWILYSNLNFPTWMFPTGIFQIEFLTWIFQLEFSNALLL